jgi:MauM/NapG family ferredoxin protein
LSFLASRTVYLPLLILAGTITVITLVFGRVFCGFICPLGALIDFSDKNLFRKKRIKNITAASRAHNFKYAILLGLFVSALFGSLLPLFMDPISITTRVFTLAINTLTAIIANQARASLSPAFPWLGLEHLRYETIIIPLYYGIIGSVILAGSILLAGIFDRRFWCQYVCPTGAMLGFLGRFSLFRRKARTELCNNCASCSAVCPTHAISSDGVNTKTPECIVCGNCSAMKKGCSRFGFFRISRQETDGVNLKRRQALAGIAGGLLIVPALGANASKKRDDDGRVVRPPGSIPESEFLARCISCGACMKVCPTNAIHPCTFKNGFQRLYTPKIVARIGGCEEKCHICGYVCPTGAIRNLSYEEKRFAKIGTAVINRHRCLAWEQNKECVVCDEICPYNAITPKIVQTTTGPFKVPIVDEDLCIGCGMCEQHCPITDNAAIVVYRFGENRRFSGPYVTESAKKEIMRMRRKSDSGIAESFSAEKPKSFAPGTKENTKNQNNNLPPGFVD